MNQLRSWLYGHEVQNRWPHTFSHKGDTVLEGSHAENDNNISDDLNKRLSTSDIQPSQRQVLLRYVPLQPGDCLGCKLVGTSVMAISGIIVLTSFVAHRKRNPFPPRKQLLLYRFVCGSLFVGCEAAAICRFFDLGFFANIAK